MNKKATFEGYKIRDKLRGYGVSDETYKTRKQAELAMIMKMASLGGDWEVFNKTKQERNK